MANPQTENGYTQVANEIIEHICRCDLNGVEFRIILFVWRKTWGWKQKSDSISFSQFEEAIGASRRMIIYGLQNLEAKNILLVTHNGTSPNIYQFNKDYDSWLMQNIAPQVENNRSKAKKTSAKLRTTPQLVQNYASASAKLRKKVVQNVAPTKETTKETNTKEIYIKPFLEELILIVNPREKPTKDRIGLLKSLLVEYTKEEITEAAKSFSQSDWHRQNNQMSIDNLLRKSKFGIWYSKSQTNLKPLFDPNMKNSPQTGDGFDAMRSKLYGADTTPED